jgi:glucose/mannose transport system permease protein
MESSSASARQSPALDRQRRVRLVQIRGAEACAEGAAYFILAAGIVYVVGFTLWTIWISFTDSTLLPSYAFVGFKHYSRLLQSRVWHVAYSNLLLYGAAFIVASCGVGMLLAVLIDQKIRAENLFRTIFLYPMALSFVVTGTVWAWILNPTIGAERFVRGLGWTGFRFDWIVDRNMAIYTISIAAVWQASGFAMALFLAGLRSLDADLYRAAQIDGASPLRMYVRILIPAIWPVVVSVLVILLQLALKTYDLVQAMTAGGPGIATMLPTNVVYDYMFQRGQMGEGSAAAVMLLISLLILMLPYLALQRIRRGRQPRNG